jgi:hypothetical protein
MGLWFNPAIFNISHQLDFAGLHALGGGGSSALHDVASCLPWKNG